MKQVQFTRNPRAPLRLEWTGLRLLLLHLKAKRALTRRADAGGTCGPGLFPNQTSLLQLPCPSTASAQGPANELSFK